MVNRLETNIYVSADWTVIFYALSMYNNSAFHLFSTDMTRTNHVAKLQIKTLSLVSLAMQIKMDAFLLSNKICYSRQHNGYIICLYTNPKDTLDGCMGTGYETCGRKSVPN